MGQESTGPSTEPGKNDLPAADLRGVQAFMAARGLSTGDWAKRAEISESVLSEFLAGQSGLLEDGTVAALAGAEGVSVASILSARLHPAAVREGSQFDLLLRSLSNFVKGGNHKGALAVLDLIRAEIDESTPSPGEHSANTDGRSAERQPSPGDHPTTGTDPAI